MGKRSDNQPWVQQTGQQLEAGMKATPAEESKLLRGHQPGGEAWGFLSAPTELKPR